MYPMNKQPVSFTRPGFRHLLALSLLAAVAAAGYIYLPESRTAAQRSEPIASDAAESDERETATQAMIDFALNLRSASEYSVYAEKGIVENGGSEITGSRGDASHSPRKIRRELADAIDAIRQLPCTDTERLSGSTFTPGVYCISSAEIDGDVTVNGQGNTDGTYIFRVAGTLGVAAGASVKLENGAQAGHVFFVAENLEIGDNASLPANFLASGDVRLGSGATVTERVMALGKAELNESAILGGSTGKMKICVEQPLPVAPLNDLSDRIFHFTVTGATGLGTGDNPVRVPVGTCSGLFDVTAGPQNVTQLNTGGLVNSPSENFTGNFELVNVDDTTPASPSSLGHVNLATRVATVSVAPGGEAEQMALRFTNRHAVTGFVEICQRASSGPRQFNPSSGPLGGGDPDVTGFFSYTIEDIYAVNQQNPNIKTLQVFTIPVGQCTGPITVTKGDPAPFGIPTAATVIVSMLPRPGVFLEGFDVLPFERRNGPDVKGTIIGVGPTGSDVAIPAPGGGYVDVIYPQSISPENETLVISRVRSNPARVKVCKVAGPGVPVNTLFRFTATGTGSLTATHPQAAEYGQVTRTFDVRAGDPAQGGTCEFVPGLGANAPGYSSFQTFLNGTPVTIVEEGISPNNTIEQNPGQLRVSQVRVFGAQFASAVAAGFSPNPLLSPGDGFTAKAAVTARAQIAEVEFVGFRFNPAVLKVCSRTDSPTLLGTERPFTISLVSPRIGGAHPGPMFPAFSTSVTVSAGPASSAEGNCGLVNGSGLPGGAFNQGSTITITQGGTGIEWVREIACPTCGPSGFTSDTPTRRATLSGPTGLQPGLNAVVFTTTIADPICRAGGRDSSDISRLSCRAPNIDFDGDHKSDPAVFSPTQLRFSALLSASNYQLSSSAYGQLGDRPVVADYDGDSKADLAIWRPSEGRWYVQGSTGMFDVISWGEPGDIPLTGDYDADGRSDYIIYRPFNGTWYIRTRQGNFHTIQFGIPTDKPMVADFDGDGRADISVFRNGTWYFMQSTVGFSSASFGQTGDVPVPADFDGDGKSDLALYRPSEATWYILNAAGFIGRQLGLPGDIPVPADYDGDGKTDISVWRPSTGQWYIRRSSFDGSDVYIPPYELGEPTDIPLQARGSLFWDDAASRVF